MCVEDIHEVYEAHSVLQKGAVQLIVDLGIGRQLRDRHVSTVLQQSV